MLKIINAILPASTATISITDTAFADPECKIEIYTDDMTNVYPINASVSGSTLTLTFDKQVEAHQIRIMTNRLTGEFIPVKSYNELADLPELFSGDYDDLTNKPELFSGDYEDLANKPDIPQIDIIPLTSEGEHIADIDLNGDTYSLYAPAGGGASYSLNEQVVGTWIDGKPLYRKVISFGALPNNTTKNVAHGVADVDHIHAAGIYAVNPGSGITLTLPYANPNNIIDNVAAYVSTTNVTVADKANLTIYSECYFIIEYTKTTD